VKVGGREQLAIEAFADAMESIPLALAENAGLDPIDVMVELRAKHENPENRWFGLDVYSGKVKNTRELSVLEPLRVKSQVVKSATEAASMILRIDDVVASKGMKGGGPPGGPPGGMPPGGGGEFD
jgi:chaperonin GroEL (HSP60 family)